MNYWKHKALVAALLGACVLTGEATAAPLPEDQLAALERANVVKGGVPGWDFLFKRFPQFGYVAAYDPEYAAAKSAAPSVAKADEEPMRLASYSPDNSAKQGYSRASDAAAFGSAATAPLSGSMVPGAPAHVVGGALAVASIAFDVLAFFSSGNVDDNIRNSFLKELAAPSLYLVKRGGALKDDDARYAEIVAGQKMMQSFGIDCEPARWHSSRDGSVGGITPGVTYNRFYTCGYKGDQTVSFFDHVDELRVHKVASVSDGTSWQMIILSRLDAMKQMPNELGLPADKMKDSGRVLYEKIKDKVGPEWTALYTAPGADGKWHVYAAREDIVREFDAPPKPKY